MTPPIQGMTVEPWGEDYMMPAFVGLVQYAAGDEDSRAAFKEATGSDIARLVSRSAIEAAVDRATGYDKDLVGKFADWVATQLWNPEPHHP